MNIISLNAFNVGWKLFKSITHNTEITASLLVNTTFHRIFGTTRWKSSEPLLRKIPIYF